MSVTSKVISTLGGQQVTVKGSVSGSTTTLSVTLDGTSGNDYYYKGVPAKSDAKLSSQIKLYINDILQNVTWTWKTKTKQKDGYIYYNPVTSSTITVNSHIFGIKIVVMCGNEIQTRVTHKKDEFSFYDIENAATAMSVSGGVMNGSTQSTVNYTTSSVDATYKTTFTLGSYSGSVTSTTKQTKYAIPASWCNALPNAVKGTATITGQVLYGGVVYKEFTTTLSVSVPSSFVPTLSAFTFADKTDTPVPSSWGIFVQGKSGARVSAITCAGVYSSTIKTIKFAVGTVSVTKDYSTSDLPVISTITQSGTLTAIVTVTDSRGRTATLSKTVSYVPYSNPKFTTVKSERCNSEGGDDIDGTYFLSTTGCEFSSCSNKNSITLQVQYKKTDVSSYGAAVSIVPGTNVCGGDLDTEFSYDVLYTLKDQFTTVTYVDYVSTAVYLMHFLHGGKGVAFGQKATREDTLDCAFDAIFRKSVYFMDSNGVLTPFLSQSAADERYLKLTGGTLSGNLVIGVNTDTDAKVLYLNNVKHTGSIQINTSGTFGAWSYTHSKWVWNCSASGGSVFNGLAIQATQAANGVGLGIGAGSSLSFNAVYAGTITGGQTVLQFFIPTSRVLSGTPTCTALSIILRHADGGYPYARSGSNGATYTPLGGDHTSIWASGKTVRTGEIKSISCANKTDGVLVTVTFGYQLAKTSGSTTAVTNNVPVSVVAVGTITFA